MYPLLLRPSPHTVRCFIATQREKSLIPKGSTDALQATCLCNFMRVQSQAKQSNSKVSAVQVEVEVQECSTSKYPVEYILNKLLHKNKDYKEQIR